MFEMATQAAGRVERSHPGDEEPFRPPDPELLARADAAHAALGSAFLAFFRAIAELEASTTDWEAEGAHDAAHLLGIRYGLSRFRAERYLACARALRGLPRLARALAEGVLGVDEVVELARFATLADEAELIAWARTVSCGAIRHRAELAARAADPPVRATSRSLEWRFTPAGRFELWADLPALDGAVVAGALERAARDLPEVTDQDPAERAADALLALCEGRGTSASVLVHVRTDGTAELEGGVPIAPAAAERLACAGAVQVLAEDPAGDLVAASAPQRREPPTWMVRQLRYRDRECRFPGCGARRYTQAHHIRFWSQGGRTELSNLALVCSFHHRLVHEGGWRVRRRAGGELTWYRPDGSAYVPGPDPPDPPPRGGPPGRGSGRESREPNTLAAMPWLSAAG